MKSLILKNLTAHRIKNKLTSIIYSLTLGILILIIVTVNVELIEVKNYGKFKNTDLTIQSDSK